MGNVFTCSYNGPDAFVKQGTEVLEQFSPRSFRKFEEELGSKNIYKDFSMT